MRPQLLSGYKPRYLATLFTTVSSSGCLWYFLSFTKPKSTISCRTSAAPKDTYGSLYLTMEFGLDSLDSSILFVFHTSLLQGQRITMLHQWRQPCWRRLPMQSHSEWEFLLRCRVGLLTESSLRLARHWWEGYQACSWILHFEIMGFYQPVPKFLPWYPELVNDQLSEWNSVLTNGLRKSKWGHPRDPVRRSKYILLRRQ